ncbi:MAG TPA: Gfo/Idh/MocA family oxidoreductase [Blastocatellia bacterium]|nr:Gfo/Idh/MocA family oxidoreductase [Blastocatellia bacterium]
MKKDRIGVGLVGTGFARSAQAPAFRACNGADLVAVCSGSFDNAGKVAEEFGIPHACENWQQMVALDEASLVVVAAPPYLHHPVTMAALAAGRHVICEKPMAMNAREAREMAELAASRPGQLAIIDHELRFNPTRRRMKEMIDDDYVGSLAHVTVTVAAGFRHSAQRPWNWWAEKSKGGGLLGALGSHAIDQLRWLFGEIESVCADVATLVPARPDPKTGEMRANETDDYCSFLVRFAPRQGRVAHGTVLLTALYASGGRNQMTVAGERGTLILDGDEKLIGSQGYNTPFEDFSLTDRALEIADIPENLWARSFYHLARETVIALQEGRTEIPHAATFSDGLRCQEVIDAITRSQAEKRWVEIPL